MLRWQQLDSYQSYQQQHGNLGESQSLLCWFDTACAIHPSVSAMTEEDDTLMDKVLICQAVPQREKVAKRTRLINKLDEQNIKDFR